MQKTVPFSMAIECRYPEQIAVCIARDAAGMLNPMTIGWFMPVSMRPPMLALAVGKTRHTHDALLHARAFVLALLSEPQAEIARHFGTHSGSTCDKFAAMPTCLTRSAAKVDSVLLTEAVANFECELRQTVDAGDHTVFFGEVVCATVTDNPLNRMFTLVKAEHLDGVRQRTT